MKKVRNDILLGAGLIALAAMLYLIFLMFRAPGGEVVIQVDGTEWGRYALKDDCRIEIPGIEDRYNVLIISHGAAWMEQASCPDKICVKSGVIRYRGETIVCLPNQVLVTIEGGQARGADVVAR